MKYIIKSGDTLGTIAKALLGDSSRYVDILKSNNIEDPNKIFVGQILNIPKKENIEKPEDTSNSSNNFTNYIVKAGDNLSKIAREHNQDLNTLIRYNNISNPNNLFIGQSIKLLDTEYKPKVRNINEVAKIEEDLNNKSNLDIINYYHSIKKTGEPYIVDDKLNNKIHIYKDGILLKSYRAIHGKNRKLDDMTVTKTDKNGKIINLAGNLSTPAGIFFSTRTLDYHGAPAWMRRTKEMVLSNNPNGIPSSIHARTITENANTNGCTGVSPEDLKDMSKYLTSGNIPTYILPVDSRNKFFIRNGELQFKSYDVTKVPAYNTIVSKPIHSITYDQQGLNNQNKKVIDGFIKGLIDNKELIQKKLGINSDTYNKLSKASLGILGVESSYGNKNSALGNFARYLNKGIHTLLGRPNTSSPDIYSKYDTYGIRDDNNSIGLTQIRMKYVPDNIKQLYNELGITKDSLVHNPEKAAMATIIRLADEYKRRGNIDKAIAGWNGKSSYLRMVKDKSSRFNIFEEYKVGGKFTPKKSQLVKNAETQNTKRDMRKKFIKSDRATYTNNKVRKNQDGGILNNQISIDPNLFSSWNAVESNIEIPTNNISIPETKLDRFIEVLNSRPSISSKLFDIDRINTEIQVKPKNNNVENNKAENNNKEKINLINPSKGTEEFNRIYDEVEREYPEASKYRAFLTTVAKYESGFNSKAKNKNAPAWGYFQFMQDDNKYNNIKTYAGVDIQTFLDNPKLQIIAAINLAKSMEKGFSKEDISAAKSKGITKWGMLGGAWLGGNGGLRRYLLNNENISDKHWSPNNSGIDMINQIKRYNFE